jgi:hypothetical protein
MDKVLPCRPSLQLCMRLYRPPRVLGTAWRPLGACAAMQNRKTVHLSRTTCWSMQPVPKTLLGSVCRICRCREKLCDSKRCDSTELIKSGQSVVDFPPDVANPRIGRHDTASRMDDFTVKSKSYAFMESRLSLSAGHVPPG